MGFLGLGGAPKRKKIKQPRLDYKGEWAQGALYDFIGRGMAGQGLYPSGYERSAAAYTSAYREAQPELQSQINRAVPQGDTKVRNYLGAALQRGYQGTLRSLEENEISNKFTEQTQATGMGFEALAGERRMGVNVTNMANESALRQAQMPSFAGELSYGLGSAAGWLSAGDRYAQGMAGGLR